MFLEAMSHELSGTRMHGLTGRAADAAEPAVLRPVASSLEGSMYSFMHEMSTRLASLSQVGADLESAKSQIAAIHHSISQLSMVRAAMSTCACMCAHQYTNWGGSRDNNPERS